MASSAHWSWLNVALLFVLFSTSTAKSIIKTLPGYPGNLPFTLETGYVSVRSGDVQLFYYFVESENDPDKDPIILWLTGGPGCSGFSTLIYEIGPLAFDSKSFNGSLPTLVKNPYSWTKFASIIFIDAPVGTGFSYATKQDAWRPVNDHTNLADNYDFIKSWLLHHPQYIKNPLYLGGESYSGTSVPLLAYSITQGNKNGTAPRMNLSGYVLGNPLADLNKIVNSRIPYAYRMGLVSDEYYEAARTSCKGDYVNVDPSNTACISALAQIGECTANVNEDQILYPKCDPDHPKPSGVNWEGELPMNIRLPTQEEPQRCRVYDYQISVVWANDPSVQKALSVRNETFSEWRRCNRSMGFVIDITNPVDYHHLLTNERLRVLIYSGDHDMIVPHFSTLEWIKGLNLTLDDNWRPWFVEGQVGGFTERYKNTKYTLTFATVKGGGHTAPEFRPKECYAAGKTWFSNRPL